MWEVKRNPASKRRMLTEQQKPLGSLWQRYQTLGFHTEKFPPSPPVLSLPWVSDLGILKEIETETGDGTDRKAIRLFKKLAFEGEDRVVHVFSFYENEESNRDHVRFCWNRFNRCSVKLRERK